MKEDLIKKWLNDELSPEELEAFKALDEYASFVRLSKKAKYFRSPDFNQKQHLEDLKSRTLSQPKASKYRYLKYIGAAAAVLLIAFTLFKTLSFDADIKSFETLTAKTQHINLPDQSLVIMNANSQLSYDEKKWTNNRQLQLNGEAYFEVQKGSEFKVNTNYADVEVLGTVFNVKARDYAFEVTCFEGSVGVKFEDKIYVVEANNKLLLENGNLVLQKIETPLPDWKKQKSIMTSKPLDKVIKEFTNYYNVEFIISDVDTSRLYTGSFTHNDMEIALNSITLPMGLTYKIDGKKIFLSKQ